MNAVNQAGTKGATRETPLAGFLAQFGALCHAGDYKGIAESFSKFVAEHPTVKYMAAEAVPAKIADHIVKTTGAPSAFVTYTLRHPTWAVDLQNALTDPPAFVKLVEGIEAGVKAGAKPGL